MHNRNRSMRGKFMSEKQTPNTRGQSHPAVEKIAKIVKEIDAVRHELCRHCENIVNVTGGEVKIPKAVLLSDDVEAAQFWWATKKDKWLEKWQRDAAYQSAISKLSAQERRLLCL
jgi:predicted aldo/keto reductase-like oxidoreductase